MGDSPLDVALQEPLAEAERLGLAAPPLPAAPELLLVELCARDVPSAIRVFDARYLQPAAQRVARQRSLDGQELLQTLRERLLVGPQRVERLRGWRGVGSLAGWLRAITARLALDQLPAHPQAEEAEWDAAIAQLTSDANPELALIAESRRVELRFALREALGRLPRREKVVLRLHLFQSLSTDQLARVFHVAPSTVRRWIQGARTSVLENVRLMLRRTARWSTSQIDSALTSFSQLDLSHSALDSEPGPASS